MADKPSAKYATVEDLRLHWPEAPADDAVLAHKLWEAEVHVLALYRDIPQRIEDDLLDPAVVTLVLCRMVKRALQPATNGMEGLSSISQGAGPFSRSLNFTGTDGAMYLTKADRNLLGSGRGAGRAFTIHPGRRS